MSLSDCFGTGWSVNPRKAILRTTVHYMRKYVRIHQGEKVMITKVSSDAILISIEAQQDSTPSQVHLVILRRKVNFLSICIIMVICVLLLLNFCVIGVVELFHVHLFLSFAIIVTDVFVSILYQAWCSILCLDEAISNAFSYCNLPEKGAHPSVVVDIAYRLRNKKRLETSISCCSKGSRTTQNSSKTANTILRGEYI